MVYNAINPFVGSQSGAPLPISVAITSPSGGASLTQGTPVTISGTVSASASSVQVYLGSTTLGSAIISGLTWSYSWTPQSGDVGAQTINATAIAAIGGAPVNAVGVTVTVTSAAGVSYATLLTSPLQVVQTDLGLTYGGTPRATGTSPPVATLAGTLTKDNAVPLWFKCTTGGAIGSGAVFSAYVDDLGVTPIMTGITPTVGTPISITGSSVLSGMTVAWAAGTANVDNVWKATCAGLQDQSGAGKHYTQATASLQPVIKIGVNGKVSLGFSGTQCLVSALNVSASWSQIMAVRRNSWSGNANYAGANSAGNLGVLYDTASTPIMAMYAGGTPGANSNSNLALGVYGAIEAGWTGSASDFLRLGSAAAVTGGSAGSSFGTGRNIGANGVGASADFDFLMSAIYPPQSSAALRTALNTVSGYGVGSMLA